MLLDAAEEIEIYNPRKLRLVIKNHKKSVKRHKPWFSMTCRQQRKLYLKAKKQFKLQKTNFNRKKPIELGKSYKQHLGKSKSAFHKNFCLKLRSMKLKNPKEYWSLINRDCSQSEPEAEISTDALISYFKELSLDLNKDEIKCIPTRFEEHQNSNGLSNPIRKDEVKNVIKHLKNNKACGRDELINEFFKASQNKMIDIYSKLFNLVLISGKVPEVWTIGILNHCINEKVIRLNLKITEVSPN